MSVFTPELVITLLFNLLTIGASYVGLRVQLEHRMTKLETHMDQLIRGEAVERRRGRDLGE